MTRTGGGALTLSEDDRGPGARRIGRLVALLLVVALGGGGWVGVRRAIDSFTPAQCEVRASGQSFTWAPDQASNTAVITAIAIRRGLPPRAATIAIATAIQESKVRNITYGDRDSVGLFQQRPSQGWGTVEQIMNPEYSSNAFYDALIKVPDWQNPRHGLGPGRLLPRRDRLPPRGADNGRQRIRRRRPDQPGPRAHGPGGG